MFAVTEERAATIRTVFEHRGELSAVIELRRMFPAIRGRSAGAGMRAHHCRLEGAARTSRRR
jgi:hypothetical protein